MAIFSHDDRHRVAIGVRLPNGYHQSPEVPIDEVHDVTQAGSLRAAARLAGYEPGHLSDIVFALHG